MPSVIELAAKMNREAADALTKAVNAMPPAALPSVTSTTTVP